MSATLTLQIPESVVTRFLVATDERVRPGTGYLRDALGGGGPARTARDLLASPLLVVTGGRATDSLWADRPAGLGGGEVELAAARSARHQLVVTSVAAPAAQPRHAQAARLVARVLAAATSGVVADLAANQVLSGAGGPPVSEPERFILGEDWLGVFVAPDAERGVRADTVGLHRFGLPELLVRDVPYGCMLTAVNVLRGLAFRMLTEHWAWLSAGGRAGPREISADRDLDPGDVLRFWGARPGRVGGALPVHLMPERADCPECDAGLRVTGPGGDGAAGWWERAAGPAIPALVSAAPDPE